MENSFFIYTENSIKIDLERFHICIWEFDNNTSLVEFGFEISNTELLKTQTDITLYIYIPWAKESCSLSDLYEKLRTTTNSRFIFNDTISTTENLDNNEHLGSIITFSNRTKLCLIPSELKFEADNIISINLKLNSYKKNGKNNCNIYTRFSIAPPTPYISMRKKGISKSTIIYDIKINEKRNIPKELVKYFSEKSFCKINYCFCFNIHPNKYDIIFLDNTTLKSLRTLEYASFNDYLNDKRIKKDEYIVVFNKKEGNKNDEVSSFSFFSIFSKERIGTGQFALAILINIVCGILFFKPSYEKTINNVLTVDNMPVEIYIIVFILLTSAAYFWWPIMSRIINTILNIFKKTKQ